MKLNRLRTLVILSSAALPVVSRAAALRYSVTDLTSLYSLNQEPRHFSEVAGLNDRGDLLIYDLEYNDQVGTPRVTTLSVEHRDGTGTFFPVPYAPGYVSQVRMNNRGEVAALVFPDRDNIDLTTREVWVYSAAGVAGRLEGMTGMENLSFNDQGQVAVSNTEEDRAFRYTPGVGWEDLGSLSNDGFAVPRALNNSGAVVGGTSVGASETVTPFLYRDGSGMESIPAPSGLGRAINDNFVITGDGGFVYYANEMRMAYVFGDQALGFIRPHDINLLGAIVGGTDFSSPGLGNVGFVWTEDDGRQLLTDLVADPGWKISDANAINDDGWILANGSQRDGTGLLTYFLLRPVPEPSPLVLLSLAVAISLARRR